MAKYKDVVYKDSLYIAHSNRIVMDHDCARFINGPVAYVWAAFTALLFQAGPPAIIFHVADARESIRTSAFFIQFSRRSPFDHPGPKGITIRFHSRAGQYIAMCSSFLRLLQKRSLQSLI